MPSPHASSASSSHQIMARRGQGFLDQKPCSPSSFLLPGSVQASALSALSDSQTAEVWDPLPDLRIISQRNATNEALWGTDAERAAWAKTTCHSHLMITHTRLCHRGFQGGLFVCVCIHVVFIPCVQLILQISTVWVLSDDSSDSFISSPLNSALCQTFLYMEEWGRTFITGPHFCTYQAGEMPLSIWDVISGRAEPSRTLYPSFFRRYEAVYYYSTEVISDAMCPHAKNNAPNMPWITHGHCSGLHICIPACPWEMGSFWLSKVSGLHFNRCCKC